jgi:hypothetical protein
LSSGKASEASAAISYAPRPDATPEAELFTLANVYKFVLNCHSKKEATRPGGPDDGTKSKEDSANAIIPKRS